MIINAFSAIGTLNKTASKINEKTKAQTVTNPIAPITNKNTEILNDKGAFKSYFLGGMASKQPVNFGGNKKPDPIKDYINHLPFAADLSPADKRNLGNVLRKNDEETDYMKKMIHLVCKDMVTPSATASLCKHGQMSDFAKQDIDTYYDKVKGQNMSVKDAFVPQHASQKQGQDAAKVGDVFRVEGQENIYIKSGDNSSKQLKMDADMYLKLYPPVSRYAACQGGTGDCYLLSSINAIMENPYSRAAIYDCFTQKGNDIVMKLPGGKAEVLCPEGKLPKNSDYSKYTDGPTGMKLLEHMYGVELQEQKFEEYNDVVSKEFKKMEKDLARWENTPHQDNLAIKKQKEIKTRMENWSKGKEEVEKAKNDPQNKKVFLTNDYGEFVIGKFGPMMEDVNKVDEEYHNPSDFYCGAYGGFAEYVLNDFGFKNQTYITGKDDKQIDKALFAENPQDYIIAAGTPMAEEGEMESPQEVSYSIYSSHEYKVIPFDDENGNRMFKVTNPWNQSHQIVMDVDKLKEFFEDFNIVKVNNSEDQKQEKAVA